MMDGATNVDAKNHSFTGLCLFASSTTSWSCNLEARYLPSQGLSFLILKMKGLNWIIFRVPSLWDEPHHSSNNVWWQKAFPSEPWKNCAYFSANDPLPKMVSVAIIRLSKTPWRQKEGSWVNCFLLQVDMSCLEKGKRKSTKIGHVKKVWKRSTFFLRKKKNLRRISETKKAKSFNWKKSVQILLSPLTHTFLYIVQ